MTLENKRILILIGGGIAAYKVLDLIRRLKEKGASVRAVLTRAATEFVTPLSVASLSGDKAYVDLFDLTDEAEIGHIELSRDADLLVVAPATADLMAKMATGSADDLASTVLLATDKKVLIAPAMNVRMWQHPATRRNLERLLADGVRCVGPNEGDMACGEWGPGRMAEPQEILRAIDVELGAVGASGPLSGRRILVTAGPTHEPIDPVRYIANRSSGKQGYAVARAAVALGAEVVLVAGPVALTDPPRVKTIRVETAEEMLAACEAALPVDAAVCTAAVADWRVTERTAKKLKKEKSGERSLHLTPNPDILKSLAQRRRDRPTLVVGFAAETDAVIEEAKRKLDQKGCDWIVANDVRPETAIMGGDENEVHLVTRDGVDSWARMSKQRVAEKLAQRIAAALSPSKVTPMALGSRTGKRRG